ncbi:hypothetical protein [Muricoccus vinaceus]|uniref:Phage gp6-like head-tail connector protein n=1 Tax=Muricoccus vinaceus TaxID=424704 RepID=A0ABV6J1Z3_9PROT
MALPSWLPPLPSANANVTNPDAMLIQTCARYLELESIINDRTHPDARKNADQMPEWPEYVATERLIETAIPQTAAGAVALAHVALQCSEGREVNWSETTPSRIAHALLLRLAGGAA